MQGLEYGPLYGTGVRRPVQLAKLFWKGIERENGRARKGKELGLAEDFWRCTRF